MVLLHSEMTLGLEMISGSQFHASTRLIPTIKVKCSDCHTREFDIRAHTIFVNTKIEAQTSHCFSCEIEAKQTSVNMRLDRFART